MASLGVEEQRLQELVEELVVLCGHEGGGFMWLTLESFDKRKR